MLYHRSSFIVLKSCSLSRLLEIEGNMKTIEKILGRDKKFLSETFFTFVMANESLA